jgi:hypothetical protein
MTFSEPSARHLSPLDSLVRFLQSTPMARVDQAKGASVRPLRSAAPEQGRTPLGGCLR